MNNHTYTYSGMFTTALRWVAGWTYFSAFWRRLILENKLNPDEAGYIGEKFNHFLPNALGIKPIIEHLVSNPDQLWYAMVTLTTIEGMDGLFLILGFYTRLMRVGMLFLAMGILLGSGWLGTTCLDEWQIVVLGVASGFVIFFSGGGKFSLDEYFTRKNKVFTHKKSFGLLGSGKLPLAENAIQKTVLIGSVFIFGLTLFTNQYFHGGVYGTLHNLSVRPHVTITDTKLGSELSFTVFRDEGADVYGSFLIGIKLLDENNNVIFEQKQEDLSTLNPNQIHNYYVAKVKPGTHSLILPLGAKATLMFSGENFAQLKGNYILELLDISGAKWESTVVAE